MSLFSGMTLQQKQVALASAQAAYIALLSGGKPETVSYAQGDGNKSVTFTRANIGALSNMIAQLQYETGVTRRARAPIIPVYR
jgi:hypothetical protein